MSIHYYRCEGRGHTDWNMSCRFNTATNVLSTHVTKYVSCAEPEEGVDRGQDPLENQKAVAFLNNTGPDPLKDHKATKLAFNIGPHFK